MRKAGSAIPPYTSGKAALKKSTTDNHRIFTL